MPRRRQKKGLFEEFASLPWQFSAAFGVAAFILMRWVIPAFFAKNPFLLGLALTSKSLAWIPLVLFGLTGLIAFSRTRSGQGTTRQKMNTLEVLSPAVPLPTRPQQPFEAPPVADPHGFGNSAGTISEWTVEGLRELEWKRFELLCAGYYGAMGFKTQTLKYGPDGGIDVKLFKGDLGSPLAVVQCKAWNTRSVGVKEIRELLGVLSHEKVKRGVFITTSFFTKEAANFGAANPIQLIDGEGFLTKLRQLPQAAQTALLESAFAGDYKTPTCSSCGGKMVKKESKGSFFWGCPRYPRCKSRIFTKS